MRRATCQARKQSHGIRGMISRPAQPRALRIGNMERSPCPISSGPPRPIKLERAARLRRSTRSAPRRSPDGSPGENEELHARSELMPMTLMPAASAAARPAADRRSSAPPASRAITETPALGRSRCCRADDRNVHRQRLMAASALWRGSTVRSRARDWAATRDSKRIGPCCVFSLDCALGRDHNGLARYRASRVRAPAQGRMHRWPQVGGKQTGRRSRHRAQRVRGDLAGYRPACAR